MTPEDQLEVPSVGPQIGDEVKQQRVLDDLSIAGQEEMLRRVSRNTFISSAANLEARAETLWALVNKGLLPTFSDVGVACGEEFYDLNGDNLDVTVRVGLLVDGQGRGYFAEEVKHPILSQDSEERTIRVVLSTNGLIDLLGEIRRGLASLEAMVGEDTSVLTIERDSTIFQSFESAAGLQADIVDLIEETLASAAHRYRFREYGKTLIPKTGFDVLVGELVAIIRGLLGPFSQYYPHQVMITATKEVLWQFRNRNRGEDEPKEDRDKSDLSKQVYVHRSEPKEKRRDLGRRRIL